MLESFKRRVIDHIPHEFLVAACLDPQQVNAPFTRKFVEASELTVQQLLKSLVQKYELNEVAQVDQEETTQSSEVRAKKFFI